MSYAPCDSCRLVQKALVKNVSRCETSTSAIVGPPHVAEYQGHKVAGSSLGRGGVQGQKKPDAVRQEVHVHLLRNLHEV